MQENTELKEEVAELMLAMCCMMALTTIESFIEQMSDFDKSAFKGYYLIDPQVFALEVMAPEHAEIITRIQNEFTGTKPSDKDPSLFKKVFTESFSQRELQEYFSRSISLILFLEKGYEKTSIEMSKKIFSPVTHMFYDALVESSATSFRKRSWVEIVLLKALPPSLLEAKMREVYDAIPLFQNPRNRTLVPADRYVATMGKVMQEGIKKAASEIKK